MTLVLPAVYVCGGAKSGTFWEPCSAWKQLYLIGLHVEKESSNWSQFFWHARFPVLPNVIAKPRTIPIFLGLACTASNFSMNFICKLKVRSHNGPALPFQRFLHQLPSLVGLHSDNAHSHRELITEVNTGVPPLPAAPPTCTDCRPAP